MTATLFTGDCLEVLRTLPSCSVHAVVTDPPYGLSPDKRARTWDDIAEGRARGGFMGAAWDYAVPGVEWSREVLRVLRPGGALIAFSSTRTVHRLACAIEDAGGEIVDMLEWIYYSGFPKSMSADLAIDRHYGATRETVGKRVTGNDRTGAGWKSGQTTTPITEAATEAAKRWSGYGTGLKPSHEPAIIARKPLEGTYAANVLKWGTGFYNLDACRYGDGDPAWPGPSEAPELKQSNPANRAGVVGRDFGHSNNDADKYNAAQAASYEKLKTLGRFPANLYVCPKPSRAEREQGCDRLPAKSGAEAVDRVEGSAGLNNPRAGAGRTATTVRNFHPTVKPVDLFRWIVRLVGGQPGEGVILDPFMGSGTTGIAAVKEGFEFIGIEREVDFARIAEARITDAVGPMFSNTVTAIDVEAV